jgi:hypothetical protein
MFKCWTDKKSIRHSKARVRLNLQRGLNLEKSTHYLSIYLQRIKKPKGRHMKRRGDWGGPLIENGRTK